MWELAANSIFCVEPPGDTLTRSHFYVAVVSGCIPLIFDGGDGSELYSNTSQTYWPWRIFGANSFISDRFQRLLSRIGLDYSLFCVILTAEDIFNPSKNFVKMLQRMHRDDPEHIRKLQLGVDEAAPAMVYSPSMPRMNSPGSGDSRAQDAFTRLYSLVTFPGVL
jgi:hypothetical protein